MCTQRKPLEIVSSTITTTSVSPTSQSREIQRFVLRSLLIDHLLGTERELGAHTLFLFETRISSENCRSRACIGNRIVLRIVPSQHM